MTQDENIDQKIRFPNASEPPKMRQNNFTITLGPTASTTMTTQYAFATAKMTISWISVPTIL